MVPSYIPKTYFDKYGNDNFNNWIFAVIKRIYGLNNFVPSPVRGADGGSDAEYVRANEIPFKFQIKWREVATYNSSQLRSSITSTFKKEVEKIAQQGKEVRYLFVTNVALTKNNHDSFKQIVNRYPNLNIEYWAFERLTEHLRDFEDLNSIYCPYHTREELEEVKKEALKSKKTIEKKYAKKVSAAEFRDIQYKIKDLFVDLELQKKFYYGFIYFFTTILFRQAKQFR